jgi:hypothetical protein
MGEGVEWRAAPAAYLQLGSAASIAAHVLLLVALLLVSPLRPISVQPPPPVSVEIVTQQQFDVLQAPDEAPATAMIAPAPDTNPVASATEVPAPADVTPSPSSRRVATTLFSAGLLKQPSMARVRQTLTTLTPGERAIQLCNIEGLEQIRRTTSDRTADTLVGYAMADLATSGLTVKASGGAYRNRRKWYGISFSCTVAPDYQGVTAFTYALGKPIPEDQWEAHNLSAIDEDDDDD